MASIKQAVLIMGAGLFASLNLLHAQMLSSSQSIGEVTAQPDSIVAVAAESQGLQLVAPEDLPTSGATYWWAMAGGGAVPMPFPPQDASPIYQMADNQFLVDQTYGQIAINTRRLGAQAASAAVASAVAAQSDAILNLIDQVQETQFEQSMTMAFGMDAPTPGGGDGGTNNGGDYVSGFSGGTPIDTNGLYLELTNVANGLSYLNLHNATNQVYSIWSTTNLALPFTNGQVELELWPTGNQTNVMPFSVQNFDRQNLFLRAEDWTGVDSDGDGIPDWWIWQYFGNLSETATNLDSQGNTLGDDYANGVDPNVINFSLRLGNRNFNRTNATGTYVVLGGVPSYEAVLVDDTNLNDAVWLPYDGNINLTLGATDGVYQVMTGLKGRAEDSQVTWMGTTVTLNRQTPQITLTSPTNGVVAQPWLQLQGYAALPLAAVTYDLNGLTNQMGLIIGHTLDTNTLSYTTDYFQCYDLLLNEGTNTISLHASDPAGNSFTTNLTVVLDYSGATHPVVQLTWPQDGMQVCGSSLTVRGWTEDAAAAVTATITDTNGDTNIINGEVGRDGRWWAENLPLAEGTNYLSLSVTNAAGLSSTTNIMVVKSDMTLTMNPVSDDLWLPTVNVGGTISDPAAAVYVNGVQGTNNGDGTWSANNVPVTAGGMASFDVSAVNGGDPAISTTQPKSDEMILASAVWSLDNYSDPDEVFSRHGEHGSFVWGKGGNVHADDQLYDYSSTGDATLSHDGRAIVLDHYTDSWGADGTSTNVEAYTIASEIGALSWRFPAGSPQGDVNLQSVVKYVFQTGGKGVAGSQVLVEASGAAAEILPDYLLSAGVPYPEITAGAVGQLGADGLAYTAIAEGSSVEVTSQTARPLATSGPGAVGYRLVHLTEHPALTDTNRARLNLGVGEEVDCSLDPAPSEPITWTASGGGIDSGGKFTAASNACSATVTATVGNASLQVSFGVKEPSGIDHAQIIGTNSYPLGAAGAGMINAVWIAPTSVSFYRVNTMEVGEDASNISGYFTQWTPQQLHHNTADHWTQLSWMNSLQDSAFGFDYDEPWSQGSFEWDIPQKWQVVGSNCTNAMGGCNQLFNIDSSGTVTIYKYGIGIQRSTNNVITTQ